MTKRSVQETHKRRIAYVRVTGFKNDGTILFSVKANERSDPSRISPREAKTMLLKAGAAVTQRKNVFVGDMDEMANNVFIGDTDGGASA